ncbi:MAG: nitrilase-related carbon-nitrogen hydrolase, partial [Actinomycetota bacterium]
ALACAGAELLVTTSANMEPFGNDHAVFVSARALENGLPHVYVNQVGLGEKGLIFTGESKVVSPDGVLLAQAGSSDEELLNTSLRLPAKSSVREDYLSQLRSPMPTVKKIYGTRSPHRERATPPDQRSGDRAV